MVDEILKPILWYTLYKLSELGANNRSIRVSTSDLAQRLAASQQTASRHLIELEKTEYIKRVSSPQGTEVKITDKGMEEIRSVYLKLKLVFQEPPKVLIIEGKAFSGLGEGSYYVSMKGYKHNFIKKLGFDPYPGTLNVRIAPSDVSLRKELEAFPPIMIEGFESRKRTFGQVKCYPAIINEAVDGAIILINRTHYDDSVLELIAPVSLRERLGLRDGSKVQVKVFT